MVQIVIHTDNAAFAERGPEIARILRELADAFEDGGPRTPNLYDVNGNLAGFVRVEEEGGPPPVLHVGAHRITRCVICGKDLKPNRTHVDTCGARCYKTLLTRQRAAR